MQKLKRLCIARANNKKIWIPSDKNKKRIPLPMQKKKEFALPMQ